MHIARTLPVAGERPIRLDEFEIKAADPDLSLPKVCGVVIEVDAFVARKKRCQACHNLAFLSVGQR